ncbi:MAG: UvrD-helicase domain-containing protein, partial [bacterium]
LTVQEQKAVKITAFDLQMNPAFYFAVIDEFQDVSIPQLRLLSALGGKRDNGLFFAGDLGQRIFQQPFSWKSLGVDIRGRSKTLKVNYRTSHQIRSQADRLLGPELADVDGNTEERKGTISVFNGPNPQIEVLSSEETERSYVTDWLKQRIKDGFLLCTWELTNLAVPVLGMKKITISFTR